MSEKYEQIMEDFERRLAWNLKHPKEALQMSVQQNAESNNQIQIMTPEEFEEEQKAKRAKKAKRKPD